MVDVWEEMFGIDIEEGPQIGLVDISEDIRALRLEYHVANMPFVDQCRKPKMARDSLLNDTEKGKF
uniref:Maelstrom domain-containing protein n=1 Tax=Heterorhabditis bacteriophora TaxID=37862 RepID=A0A1I7X983_HETBA